MENFYKKKKWEKKRNIILKRDDYLCQECKKYGRAEPATTVHHIIPIDVDMTKALDSNNLISLCNKCHNEMHDRGSKALSQKGIELMGKILYPPP